ncbi:amidase family protein [Neobacillus mesonae]|nr:amidase family protein [Neobacillus mesonae]
MGKSVARLSCNVLLTCTLLLPVLGLPSKVLGASQDYPELAAFMEQSWAQAGSVTEQNRMDRITAAQFVELMNSAARAAGSDLSITKLPEQTDFTRETAAWVLDEIIDVPYVETSMYQDIPISSKYAQSIGIVTTAGLMKGIAEYTYGYGKPLSKGDAAVVALRLYQYLQPVSVVETSITDLQTAMKSGRVTSAELVDLYQERIEKYDTEGPKLNSIIAINEQADDLAKQLDEERKKTGSRGALHGIPVILKDNFDTADMPTTGGSEALKDSVSLDDAYQVEKLKEAGAIILAKANLHEFAFGYTTVSSVGGQTLNPYNTDKVPGGSSGGTGASIAASFAAVGMGSDTGGSIRVPSSFNNLVGIRPTIGLSSRDGIMPLALTQDTGGPIARSVADAAAVLDATAGYDPDDVSTAAGIGKIPESYLNYLDPAGLNGARIGIVREVFGSDQDINDVMDKALLDMKEQGAVLVDHVEIPNFKQINSYASLSGWEFKFQFNDYLETLGTERPYKDLTAIIESGLYDESVGAQLVERNNRESLDDEAYKDIVLHRTKLAQEAVLKMMADYDLDALIFPTSANPIVNIGEEQTIGDGFKLSSFTGYPTVTVPAGFRASDKMPVGLDFIGRPFSEPTLIKLAYSFEQHTKHRTSPALTP